MIVSQVRCDICRVEKRFVNKTEFISIRGTISGRGTTFQHELIRRDVNADICMNCAIDLGVVKSDKDRPKRKQTELFTLKRFIHLPQ